MQADLELWEITKETLLSKISGLFIPKSKTTISEVFGVHTEPDTILGIEGYGMWRQSKIYYYLKSGNLCWGTCWASCQILVKIKW